MPGFLLRLQVDGIEPEEGAPAPGRLISGDPRFRTWNLEAADGGLYAGIWESTPGKWRIEYTEWEFCHILSGVSVIADELGEAFTVRAGDSFVIPSRLQGHLGSAGDHPEGICNPDLAVTTSPSAAPARGNGRCRDSLATRRS